MRFWEAQHTPRKSLQDFISKPNGWGSVQSTFIRRLSTIRMTLEWSFGNRFGTPLLFNMQGRWRRVQMQKWLGKNGKMQ
jgi:hypothetical protein